MTQEAPVRVCFPYIGRGIGGSHISSLGLILNLDRRRYEPHVVLQHREGPILELFERHNVPVAQAPKTADLKPGHPFGLAQAAQVLPTAPRLARFIRDNGYRLIHSNDGRTNATWALSAKMAGAKLIWHNRGNPEAAGLKLVAPWLADQVVSVSHFASPKPGLFSAAEKNAVVHSPFDITVNEDRDAARAALLEELGAPSTTRFVGFFGNLIDRKRPLLFVDAVAELKRQAPETPVMGLLFGAAADGADDEARSRAEARGAGEEIRLMGFRSPGSRWIAACDILLVPAVGEPFGRTLIEAMLVGTPVVATRSGGNPEAIRHESTGLLAEPENAAALAAEMARLLRDPSLHRRIVDAARADALSRFGEDRHANAVMDLYDKALGRGAPPAAPAAEPAREPQSAA